jgi:hypothetical protein
MAKTWKTHGKHMENTWKQVQENMEKTWKDMERHGKSLRRALLDGKDGDAG